MTPAATPEALVEALAESMLRHEWPNSPLVPLAEQDDRIRNYWLGQAKAQIAGPLAPVLADLQRFTAEKRSACLDALAAQDQAAENDERARTAEAALATATAEAASLRAENEKLKQEISDTRTELDALIQEVLKNG